MSRSSPTTPAHLEERGNTRRGFLKRSLSLAAAATLSGGVKLFAEGRAIRGMQKAPSSLKTEKPNDGQPLPYGSSGQTRGTSAEKSRVIRVKSERIMPVRVVQQPLLKDTLDEGLRLLTGEQDVRDAWHHFLSPDDVILLKFNQSGSLMLGTSVPFATALVDSLLSAGWSPDKIMLLEAGGSPRELPKTRMPDMRWQGHVVDFGSSGRDSFLAALDEATAIVNVPFLKTHHLATMTSCLKNLSHGLIRHPARFHAQGCDPAIGEIVASPPVREKVRLHIVNALRVVFDRGPDAGEGTIHTSGTILLGTDPVACDSVGFELLNETRSIRGMGPLLPEAKLPKYLGTAATLGLGNANIERIEVDSP
ncbi:MAG: DUF362 domain-containing protein [Planctomycetota bacterium]